MTKSRKSFRNPIVLARELEVLISSDAAVSKADIARTLGYSRARITQLLNLLSLSSEVLEQIEALGDYWSSPLVSERCLRVMVDFKEEEQVKETRRIFARISNFSKLAI